ncbi:hypothetical protein MASR2M15_00390 [Anaerolineales bacterium]
MGLVFISIAFLILVTEFGDGLYCAPMDDLQVRSMGNRTGYWCISPQSPFYEVTVQVALTSTGIFCAGLLVILVILPLLSDDDDEAQQPDETRA